MTDNSRINFILDRGAIATIEKIEKYITDLQKLYWKQKIRVENMRHRHAESQIDCNIWIIKILAINCTKFKNNLFLLKKINKK